MTNLDVGQSMCCTVKTLYVWDDKPWFRSKHVLCSKDTACVGMADLGFGQSMRCAVKKPQVWGWQTLVSVKACAVQ